VPACGHTRPGSAHAGHVCKPNRNISRRRACAGDSRSTGSTTSGPRCPPRSFTGPRWAPTRVSGLQGLGRLLAVPCLAPRMLALAASPGRVQRPPNALVTCEPSRLTAAMRVQPRLAGRRPGAPAGQRRARRVRCKPPELSGAGLSRKRARPRRAGPALAQTMQRAFAPDARAGTAPARAGRPQWKGSG